MLRAALVTAVVLIVLDAIWIWLVAFPQFAATLGPMLRPRPDFAAALLFYVIYAAGLIGLAVSPGIEAGSVAVAASRGALLGLTAYATYDLTNLAILQRWTWSLALVDIAWGTVLSAIAAAAGTALRSGAQ